MYLDSNIISHFFNKQFLLYYRTRKKTTTCEDTDTENDENKTPIKKFTKFLKSKPKSEGSNCTSNTAILFIM